MLIKDEPSAGWFPFLDALIRCPDCGPVEVRFNAKNYEPLSSTGALKLLTIQHRSSFMTRRTAVARMVSTLHRLRACVRSVEHRFRGCYELSVVYAAQGYPVSEFCRALTQMAQKFSEPIWSAVLRAILSTRMI